MEMKISGREEEIVGKLSKNGQAIGSGSPGISAA
jgi:hypothetical protein